MLPKMDFNEGCVTAEVVGGEIPFVNVLIKNMTENIIVINYTKETAKTEYVGDRGHVRITCHVGKRITAWNQDLTQMVPINYEPFYVPSVPSVPAFLFKQGP